MNQLLRKGIFLVGGGLIVASLFRTHKFIQNVKSLNFDINGVRLKPASWLEHLANGFTFVLDLSIINDTAEAIPFDGLDLTTYLNGTFLGNARITQGRMIPPFSKINLDLEFTTDIESMTSNLEESVRLATMGEKIVVDVQGYVQGVKVKMPVDESFILNEPQTKRLGNGES